MNTTIQSESPEELYRFIGLSGKGIEHFEDMLNNNRVKFSEPSTFNDPFDCNPAYRTEFCREDVVRRQARFLEKIGFSCMDALKRADEAIPKGSSELEKWVNERIARGKEAVRNTGILCLTSLWNNPVMWAHYAEKHTGICVKFRLNDEPSAEFIGDAQPVQYGNKCPVVDLVYQFSGVAVPPRRLQ